MSRRNHRYNDREYQAGDGWPQPPMKTVNRRFYKPQRVPTEVHRALRSFGSDDQTKRLSDGEFYSQIGGEIGYLFNLSGAHLGRVLDCLGELFGALF